MAVLVYLGLHIGSSRSHLDIDHASISGLLLYCNELRTESDVSLICSQATGTAKLQLMV